MKQSTQTAQAIKQEQLKMLADQSPMAGAGALIAACGLVWALHESLGLDNLLLWLAVELLVIGILTGSFYYRKYATSSNKDTIYLSLYWLQLILQGVTWGGLGLMAWFLGGEADFILILLALVGFATVSTLGTGVVISMFITLVNLILLPSTIVMFNIENGLVNWFALGLLAILYIGLLCFAGYVFNQSLIEAFRLRHERGLMVKHLETEVEQRKHAEQEALQSKNQAELASLAKSRFLANMSHEIRTPLTSILGFADTLLEEEQNKQDQRNMVQTIIRNGQHLLGVINDILDLSKIEANRLETEAFEFDFMDTLYAIHHAFEPMIKDKGISFNTEVIYPMPKIITSDPTRLRQILFNVLSNAMKFTAKGSINMKVSYDQASNLIQLSIKDSGIGMNPETQNRLFTAFSQADASTTRKFGGTGLGLNISKTLAQMLGGDISVATQEGLGSCFTICINAGEGAKQHLIDDYQPDQQQHKRYTKRSIGMEGRVLLAEDSPDIQQLISTYLRKTKIELEIVGDGKSAVDKATKSDYDLILMDMQMPIMDGMQATRMLRSEGYVKPIVALTANAMREERDSYLAAGADAFIAKPVKREYFLKTVQSFLSPQDSDSEIDETIDDDDEDISDLIELYKEKLPGYVEEIENLLASQDINSSLKKVHDLKGTGTAFGHPQVTTIALALELALKQSQSEQIEKQLALLNQYVANLKN